MAHGLFTGLTTLDLIYRANHPPLTNQKIVASDYIVAAGGPATNAAIAFQHFENRATLLSVIGCHPMTQLIRADLDQLGVTAIDLLSNQSEPPPVSSIIVTESTGERAVVSINAVKTQVSPDCIPADCLSGVDIVLIDGHQMVVGWAIAQQAKAQNIPIVIDGGSWKPGFETILPLTNYAICSANFHPPDCHTSEDVLTYLINSGIPHIALTHGEQPIQYWNDGQEGTVEVPPVKTVDTLGAGDIFHGAFCHAILHHDFVVALAFAAQVASHSCKFFGTRQWLEHRYTMRDPA